MCGCVALFVLLAPERHVFCNHIPKRLGINWNAVLDLKLHLIAKLLAGLDCDRFVSRLERLVLVLVGANVQANVKGAVTPVNDTFPIKNADFIFHAVAQVLLRFGALNSILCRVVQGKCED